MLLLKSFSNLSQPGPRCCATEVMVSFDNSVLWLGPWSNSVRNAIFPPASSSLSLKRIDCAWTRYGLDVGRSLIDVLC